MEDHNQPEQMSISKEGKAALLSSAKWARFLALLSSALLGLTFIGCIVMMIGGSTMIHNVPAAILFTGSMAYVLLAILAVYFIPVFYLYSFANKAIMAIAANDNKMINKAFVTMKRYYQFVGVLTVIVIVIHLIAAPIIMFTSPAH